MAVSEPNDRQAQHERRRHAQCDRADVQMRDLAIAIAKDFHIANRTGAVVDHSLGQQIHKQQEDKYREANHHADHFAHHADELVAHGAHVVGRGVAGKVMSIEVELLVAHIAVKVRSVVAEQLVKVVDTHIDIHVRLGAPGHSPCPRTQGNNSCPRTCREA